MKFRGHNLVMWFLNCHHVIEQGQRKEVFGYNERENEFQRRKLMEERTRDEPRLFQKMTRPFPALLSRE